MKNKRRGGKKKTMRKLKGLSESLIKRALIRGTPLVLSGHGHVQTPTESFVLHLSGWRTIDLKVFYAGVDPTPSCGFPLLTRSISSYTYSEVWRWQLAWLINGGLMVMWINQVALLSVTITLRISLTRVGEMELNTRVKHPAHFHSLFSSVL